MTGSSSSRGKDLEKAVAHIEETIIRRFPGFAEGAFTIEPNKILVADGVRHEVDLYVSVSLSHGYNSAFVFECKNWSDKVGKNEIIIFSEKVRVFDAQRGFFVAHSYTADALAQAVKDPRIELLTVSELNPSAILVPGAFHGIQVGATSAGVRIHTSDNQTGHSKPFDIDRDVVEVDGSVVDAKALIEQIVVGSREAALSSFPSTTADEGVHDVEFSGERVFSNAAAYWNGKELQKISVSGKVDVTISKAVVTSAYDVQGRGRRVGVKLRLPIGEIDASFVLLARRATDTE